MNLNYKDLNQSNSSCWWIVAVLLDFVYADATKTRYTGQNNFKPGGTFNHIVEFRYHKRVSDNVSVGFGSEIENFGILARRLSILCWCRSRFISRKHTCEFRKI
jgi:iron complex outermembrane receptor protein